ncbi:MAG TPA: histone deacetylase family protein [Bacillota bacterium]|nr:histone deacetylase family protein [Bacillota bacterium]
MKIVFHERYLDVYTRDPAAEKGRLDGIVEELTDIYEFVEPEPAEEQDILLVHSPFHLEHIRKRGGLYEYAALAAGGAVKAAELAVRGEPSFALIRPPGHHAGRNSCWGFCWFNNVAIAVEKLRTNKMVNKVLIVDIDLHFGDGTNDIFAHVPDVTYHHLDDIGGLDRCLKENGDCELVAVSAGFDRHVDDWGGTLYTEDYAAIGKMIAGYARRVCSGRLFAALEGGYNHKVLGKNVKALLQGFEQEEVLR